MSTLSAEPGAQVLVKSMDTVLEDVLGHGFRLDHEMVEGTCMVRLLDDATECVVSPEFVTVEELEAWLRNNVHRL